MSSWEVGEDGAVEAIASCCRILSSLLLSFFSLFPLCSALDHVRRRCGARWSGPGGCRSEGTSRPQPAGPVPAGARIARWFCRVKGGRDGAKGRGR